jgi:hypothetical protein
VDRSRALRVSLALIGVLVAWLAAGGGAEAADPFVVSHAFNLRMQGEPAKISFLSAVYVVNVSPDTVRDLVFTARAPEGFTLALAPRELHEIYLREAGDFHQELTDGAYRMTQEFLGSNQGTLLFYEMAYNGKAESATFPGIQIEYKVEDEETTRQYAAPQAELSLARYHRFSGTINDFVRRYAAAGFTFPVAAGSPEWTFVAPDYRAFGRGFVDVSLVPPDKEAQFRVQTGYPGNFREMLFRWQKKARGKKDPLTEANARTQLDVLVRWLGDYTLDPESIKVTPGKVARLPAFILEGRWLDNKPERLGSGPFRFYALHDPRGGKDYFIYVGAQGRGIGPERSETPAPEQEQKLLKEIAGIAETFRP